MGVDVRHPNVLSFNSHPGWPALTVWPQIACKDKLSYSEEIVLEYELDVDVVRQHLLNMTWIIWHTLHKKWHFPLMISSANVTKTTVFFGIGHIY